MPVALTRSRRLLPNGIVDALIQLFVVVLAYKVYQNTRGLVNDQLGASVAFANADWIVSVERALHLDIEQGVQSFATRVPGLMDLSSLIYLNAQFSVTFGAMIFIYVVHNQAFGFVRNMFIMAWTLAIVGYVAMPTAPPRLVPGLDIIDAVAQMTNVDPHSHSVSKLYNPYAAVPSMHVGFSLMVGVPLALLSRRRIVRILWALYPAVVLFVVMSTGNHFLLDGVFGAMAVGLAALGAYQLGRLRPDAWAFRRRPDPAATSVETTDPPTDDGELLETEAELDRYPEPVAVGAPTSDPDPRASDPEGAGSDPEGGTSDGRPRPDAPTD